MGRTSVDQRADKILAAKRYHIQSRKDHLIVVLFGALTFVPCCAWGAMNVATCRANEESNVCATSHEFELVVETVDDSPIAPSWIFRRSSFTQDPETGARVAQYMRKPPVEPLDDQRAVTSSYRTTRTGGLSRDGSYDTSYQVQAWGNGRGGIDAEWQMFNDVWQESILSGGYYNQNVGPWGYGNGWNNGWNNYGSGGAGWNNGWNNGPGWGGGFPNGPNLPNGGWNPGFRPNGGGWDNGSGQNGGGRRWP